MDKSGLNQRESHKGCTKNWIRIRYQLTTRYGYCIENGKCAISVVLQIMIAVQLEANRRSSELCRSSLKHSVNSVQ